MHSLSPRMHNAAFATAGIDAVYVPLAGGGLRRLPRRSPTALGVEGASITIPYKLDALAAAADADPRTRAVGAANTLRQSRRGRAPAGPGGRPAAAGYELARVMKPSDIGS